MFGMFIVVRLYGSDGYLGNLRGLPRDGVQGNWLIAFLNICKYLLQWLTLITLGVDLICLGAIQKLVNTCRCCTASHRENLHATDQTNSVRIRKAPCFLFDPFPSFGFTVYGVSLFWQRV